MSIKDFIRNIFPPILLQLLLSMRNNKMTYHEGFNSWKDAEQNATGYANKEILDKVDVATSQVVKGIAAFERDGVSFKNSELPYHFLFPLLSSAVKSGGLLTVLDYGGSLGSTYRLCRPLLSQMCHVNWIIIEQEGYVSLGKKKYENEELKFYKTINDIPDFIQPNILLFSSVLQFLPEPFSILRKINNFSKITDVLIDRTPFCDSESNKILIQRVPASIYRASYPINVLSYKLIVDHFKEDWDLIDERLSPEGIIKLNKNTSFEYKYLWFRRKNC